ncbi:MAG TPA: DUF5916 domain-containing protein [Thermoanaerobaculia bacterium]|nr:DUF5916 domain-containing protein [Thermoanaerobaculia bacterium]
MKRLPGLIIGLLAAFPLLAEERATFRAIRAAVPPVIDGTLDDPVWRDAPEITGFTQRDPDEGKPATQQTRLKVVYDDEAIYFGAFMEDEGEVRTVLARRDSDLNSGDYIRISLDSQYDRLNGAAFVVNPSGVQMDMILYNDIYDDPSWDAVWESAATVVPGGWVAEVKIPYSQLRFPERAEHVWGLNVSRWNARLRESSRLVHTPKEESGFVSRFADLTGIRGIKPRRGFEVVPYGVARTDLHSRADNPFIQPSTHRWNAGVDMKYALTSTLRLTATINPDFGQVEVDPAVLNLSQFETFFPEKRPFFTEGADVFRFGNGPSNSRWGFNMWFPTFFYSRRIGRAPQGVLNADYQNGPGETTILGAAKVTGKVGKGWTIGVFDAVTDREQAWYRRGSETGKDTVEPATNYLVARATKDYGEASRAGFMFTSVNRRLSENLESSLRGEAYFAGVDGHTLFRDKSWIVEWLGGSSLVRGSEEAITATQSNGARYYQRPDAGHVELDPTRTSLTGWMGRIMANKQSGRWRPNIQVQALSPGLELNDAGFLPNVDAISSHAVLRYYNADQTRYTREISGWAGKYQNWNFDGDLTANGLGTQGFVQFKNYWYVFAFGGGQGERIDDRITRGGPVVLLPGGHYYGGGLGNDSRKKVYFEAWTEIVNRDDGGSGRWFGAEVTYRPTPAIRVAFAPRLGTSLSKIQYVTTVADPSYTPTFGHRYVFAEIDQRTLDLGFRADWTMNARLSVQLYVQPFVASGDYEGFKQLVNGRRGEFAPYQLAGREPDFNFRSVRGSAVVRWEFRPGSALYVAWNENRSDFAPVGDFRWRRDLGALPSAPSRDVFLVKMSYWLPM